MPDYRIDLAGSYCNYGNLIRNEGKAGDALEWIGKAITTLKPVVKQDRRLIVRLVVAREWLRNTYLNRALALEALKRHADAVGDWDRAVELSADSDRAWIRMQRASSRVQTGKVDAGIKEAEELAKTAQFGTLYDAACVFALAADRKDESPASLSKEDCAKRAMELLQQAVAKGWKDGEHMKKDDDLKALRERDDFKKLLAELERKSP